MVRLIRLVVLFIIYSVFIAISAATLPLSPKANAESLPNAATYVWSVRPVGNTSELLTLVCHNCADPAATRTEIPLLAVLRDTLGDASPENDRLSYLWLLNGGHFNFGQRILSAVPFFYWQLEPGATQLGKGYPAPLLNLNAPRYPVVAKAARTLLQWAAFDPLATSIRASSRSYQANQQDHERLQLQQAIGYLRNAPSIQPGLTEKELNTLIARLELRKSLLGGLLSDRRAPRFGQQANFERECIRSRNFEALRQFAEKTGTYFEPLNLAGDTSDFAVLWFSASADPPSTGTPTQPIWKLLNVHDPWLDRSLTNWQGPTAQRAFDADDGLLPAGAQGVRTATIIPLAVYSLTYPQMPLLLIDFRDKRHVHRSEILQRSITELTTGMLGISHFANWYYYAGALVYQSIWSRRGTAANQSARLECYSQFRSQLALDHQLNPELHAELVSRAKWLNVNPLDSDPSQNAIHARVQYAQLMKAAEGPDLTTKLDHDRRSELAAFGESTRSKVMRHATRFLPFHHHHSLVADGKSLVALDRNRRIQYQLDYLDAALQNGTDPRVPFKTADLDESVIELRELLGDLDSKPIRRHVQATLARLKILSPGNEEIAKTLQVAQTLFQ